VEIDITYDDEGAKLKLEGRLDTNGAPDLQKKGFQKAFDKMGEDLYKSKVVLDFSAVKYISSAGLRVLLIFQKKMLAAHGSLSIVNLNDTVREVFDMTGFSAIFKI
jgi:anti-anti-sigma factor